MKLIALEFKQNNKRLYLTTLTARQLLDENRILPDVWSPDNPTGYQRHLSIARARLFSEFIKNPKNVSPCSVLLAIRKEPKFTPFEENLPVGILEIPDDAKLYVVDGQHRIEGIRELFRRGGEVDFSLPAVIMYYKYLDETDPQFAEAKQFVIINTTQKRVRADLHDRFIARLTPEQRKELQEVVPTEKAELIARAVAIVDQLNARQDSVWYNLVKYPGMTRRQGIVTQRTLTQSLIKSLLNDPIINEKYDDQELVDAIINWWNAWSELCPEAFKPATRSDYILQRGYVAIRVVNELLRETLRAFALTNRPPTKENFKKVIENMDEGNYSDYWKKGGTASQFRGEGGVKDLYRLLLPSLVEAIRKLR